MRRNLLASVSLVAASGPAEPPARVRIWRAGRNPGDYGELNFTRRAADAIMADYFARGTLAAIDIEHNQNPDANPRLDPNAPPVTGGYLALELEETESGPELWFRPEWSDCGAPHAQGGLVCCARHQITSKQRRYISPDWEMDLETREPVRLNRVSLVAEPATYGVNLLASRAAATGDRTTMNEEQLRAAYALAKMQAEGAEGDMKATAGAFVEQLRLAAKNLGVDLDASSSAAPANVEASAQTPPAAPPAGQLASADCATEKPNMTASRTPASTRPITQAEVDRMHLEAASKAELLAANKDRITPKLANVLASKSIAEVREVLEALPPRPAGSEGTGGDVGGAASVGPPRTANGRAKRALSPQDNFVASRIRGALGVTDKAAEAAEKAMDADGGYTFSMVQIIDEKRAERAARR